MAWRIHEICKTCKRREIVLCFGIRIADDWSNTLCNYYLHTGKERTQPPTDDYCPYYIENSND